MNGKVKWYNARKGYGFIEGEDGKDVFIHRSSIPQGLFLKEGDKIGYEIEDTDKGPKAVDIKKEEVEEPEKKEEAEEENEEDKKEEEVEEPEKKEEADIKKDEDKKEEE